MRSFSVLEGIGLATDPSYAIANEAFPYVARRLLTDKSESTKKALIQLLYGREGTRLSLDQVSLHLHSLVSFFDLASDLFLSSYSSQAKQLAEAFSSYSEIVAPQANPEQEK